MDRIEDIELDSDEDGIHITLQGDFVDACDGYMADEDAVKITLLTSPDILDALVRDWEEMKRG
jgi:hypothetical protein